MRMYLILFVACILFGCQSNSNFDNELHTNPQIGSDALAKKMVEDPIEITPDQAPQETLDYKISGPYTHENLSIFLFHGEDKIHTKKIITLEEALKDEKIKVYETGDVNELAVENLTADTSIYIHVGDIVKGGKQDRAIGKDLVVMPNSGRIPIDSFCVESGRWSNRGDEAVSQFESSQEIANKELQLALKYSKNQSTVWNKVASIQGKLSSNLEENVISEKSATSMQLTLENKNLQKKRTEYISKLQNVVPANQDSIGYILTVNGKISRADLYGSHYLFSKLWPKLLKSSTVDALSEKSVEHTAPSQEEIKTWLAQARVGKIKKQKLTENSAQYIYENETSIGEDVWIEDSLFSGDAEQGTLLRSSFSDISHGELNTLDNENLFQRALENIPLRENPDYNENDNDNYNYPLPDEEFPEEFLEPESSDNYNENNN